MSGMIYSCNIKTNLSDAFFNSGKQDEEFIKWLWNINTDLFAISISMNCKLDNISSVQAEIYDITDDHEIELRLNIIDTDKKIYDGYELADNSEFIDFLEAELIPTFIRKFNSACDIEIPMTEDNDFKDMEFRDGEFYTLLHYSNKESKYYNCSIKGVIFQLLDDFELQF